MGSCHLLAWITKEPKEDILRKAQLHSYHWDEFGSFVDHILISSVVSRHKFLQYTITHRLSWQVLGDFYREHIRRLEDNKRLYPVFDHYSSNDSPWNVHYVEWPNRFGVVSDSPFVCTISYYWVHDDEIIGNYKPLNKWKKIRARWCAFLKQWKHHNEKETLITKT